MQVDEGGAAGGERPAVGHADRGRLLKAEHVANVGRVDERVHERHLGRAGIAEDMGYALIAQDVDENVARASGHRILPSVCLTSYTTWLRPVIAGEAKHRNPAPAALDCPYSPSKDGREKCEARLR